MLFWKTEATAIAIAISIVVTSIVVFFGWSTMDKRALYGHTSNYFRIEWESIQTGW